MDVSVIVPLFNSEDTIVRALQSVLNQTFDGDIEIIVVNDGSTDNSAAKVEQLCASINSSCIVLITKKNGGVSSARNAGLLIAKGAYIAFLDADDAWLPDKLEVQLKVLQANPEIYFLGALINTPAKITSSDLSIVTQRQLIYKNYFQPSTVIMRREVYKQIGLFNETQRYAEEGNYFIRVAGSFNCALLNKKLVYYGEHKKGFGQSGLSSNLKEMEKGELLNLQFARNQKYINFPTYVIAVAFSLLKYFRRIVIVKLR